MRKLFFWFLTKSDTNQYVQPQKMAKRLEILNVESEDFTVKFLIFRTEKTLL